LFAKRNDSCSTVFGGFSFSNYCILRFRISFYKWF
jgi:hypothetical protein